MAWAESGVTFYSRSEHKFFTLDIYTCKALDAQVAVEYVRRELKRSDVVWQKIEYE